MITARIVAEADSTVGADAVRTVRVLPFGGVPPTPGTAPQAPVLAVAASDAGAGAGAGEDATTESGRPGTGRVRQRAPP
ncbi:hypothetical protein [Streptomyces sp. A0592]|uniref:hypothetical protein n=1 Tax=Streptomyces sp. A0592 TaxID=2563099 RepID=UPI0019D1F67B|nr:hypothetical protein [Streptomyces sp. A0592]